MLRNKIMPVIMAGIMTVSAIEIPVFAESVKPSDVTISTAEELIEFSEKCSLDSYSRGISVILTEDVDLSEKEFTAIPIFGGSFDGAGHTISGLKITGKGSNLGLFRYIEEDASVRNLNVIGNVTPDGTKSSVGGIVGKNSGTIKNCSFRGTIHGESNIGGIAGENSESGTITGCSVSGRVFGKTATGGIVGRNAGVIMRCENSAGVNLTNPENSDTIDIDSEIDQYINSDSNEESTNLLNSYTDSGGIAGYSSGIIQSCHNAGNVGYPHIGYNAGGIAGRQNGYLAGCSNDGRIEGRKDVGGIVGQSEPYLTFDPSRGNLEEIRSELHTLNDLIDKTLNDAENLGNDVSRRLTSMKKYTDTAEESAKSMLDTISDFVDGNMNVINATSVDLTNALDKISIAADELSDAAENLSKMSEELSSVIDDLEYIADLAELAADDVRAALNSFRKAADDLSKASENFKKAIEILADAITEEDANKQSEGTEKLITAANDLNSALGEINSAAGELNNALGDDSEPPEIPKIPELPEIPENPDINDVINTIEDTWNRLEPALNQSFDILKKASDNLDSAAKNLDRALGSLENAADDIKPASEAAKRALEKLRSASDLLSDAGKSLQSAFSAIGEAVDTLTENGPREFLLLGENFRKSGDSLYESVSAISDDVEALNSSTNANMNVIMEDLRAINAQCRKITDLVIDTISDVKDDISHPSDTIQDTSDKEISLTRQGKVTDCTNRGEVAGDRNIGGIVGIMAIELDLDPEGDLSENDSRLGASLETKSVLQNSKNYGTVTAKKDCSGGIVGRMELGTTLSCLNLGTVSSDSGSYVGGIAGYSEGVVRENWAKCELSGGNYIGGITGFANTLRDCYAIVTITEGAEYIGAISGNVNPDGILSGNRFVNMGTAAVDGISYTDRAEPISFAELADMDGIPREFTEFCLTLIADDVVVAKIPFDYGEDLSKIELPEVPTRDDAFGKWEKFDTTGRISNITLNAVYEPWITIVASSETRGKLALALAEGQFTDEAQLHAEENGDTIIVTLTGTSLTDSSVIPVRLQIPTGNVTVEQQIDGKWRQLESTRSGQYIQIKMHGTSGTFRVTQTKSSPLPFIAGGATLIIAVILIVVIKITKKRKIHT